MGQRDLRLRSVRSVGSHLSLSSCLVLGHGDMAESHCKVVLSLDVVLHHGLHESLSDGVVTRRRFVNHHLLPVLLDDLSSSLAPDGLRPSVRLRIQV